MRAAGPVDGLEFRGAESARPSEAVLAAIASAAAIVIGPSNPLASIAPILAVPGMRAALREAPAPVVAVSPIVGGEVLKGPTAAFMAFAGRECSAAACASTTAICSTGSSPTRSSAVRCRRCARRRGWTTPAGEGASRKRCSTSPASCAATAR